MRISIDKAETILKLMLEGMSIRSIQRITGAHQKTDPGFARDRGREVRAHYEREDQRHRG
jgi:hypothetical protein